MTDAKKEAFKQAVKEAVNAAAIDREIQKEAVKEAISEWMDKQFAVLGKWTLRGAMAMSFAVLVYLYLSMNGWHK